MEAQSSHGKDAVAAAATRTFDGGLDNLDEAIQTAQTVGRAGAHDVARHLFETLVVWGPNRPEVFAGLADELAATKKETDDPSVIMAALRRARESSRDDARLRAVISLRDGAPAGGVAAESRAAPQADEKYLAPSDVVYALRRGAARRRLPRGGRHRPGRAAVGPDGLRG